MRLESDPSSVDEFLKAADRLWRDVRRSDKRTMAEVKLAVVLAALRDVASEEVDDLYTRIGTSTSDSAVWLSALARELLSERPESVDLSPEEKGSFDAQSSGTLFLSGDAADAVDQEREQDAGAENQELEIVTDT